MLASAIAGKPEDSNNEEVEQLVLRSRKFVGTLPNNRVVLERREA